MGFYATAEVKEKNRYYPVFRGNKSENRLVKTESGSGVPDEFKVCVENEYDYLGRRFRKTVKDDYSGGTYTTTNVTTYVWDGMNIIAEMCDAGYTNYYTHGLDVLGSLNVAGGAGALLAVTRVTASETNTYFAAYDGNANVCQYIDESGTIVAAREYSPFGQTIALTGSKKNDFTHWWSTEPLDAETGLIMYELRPYGADIGRFLCKDPIGEAGSINMYLACRNSMVNFIDILGLKDVYAIREIKRYTSLEEQPPKMRLYLAPGGEVAGGAAGYTVDSVDYKWRMKATASYLNCDCVVELVDGTLIKQGNVSANPIIIVPGGDPMMLPTPFKTFLDFFKGLIGDAAKWAIGDVVGSTKFLNALANWDPDGKAILDTIKNTVPKDLDDMEWEDINFKPCPKK